MRRTELSQLVHPETLHEPLPASPGGHQNTYGYRIYPVTGPEDATDSNAVLLDIAPGGSTEYEHTVRDGQIMTVEARQGRADLEIFLPTGERTVRALEVGGQPAVIAAGG